MTHIGMMTIGSALMEKGRGRRMTKLKAMKNKIHDLEEKVESQKQTIAELNNENVVLRDRLTFIGTRTDLEQIDTYSVEVEAIPYGMFSVVDMANDWLFPKRIKESLALRIADALMKNNLIQYVVRDGGTVPINNHCTVGAKLYVIPWEQTVIGRKRTIQIRRNGK